MVAASCTEKHCVIFHARILKVLSKGGPNLKTFFLVDGGIEDRNTDIFWPSSARQRNAIEMAFRGRADGGPALNAGFVVCDFTGEPD